jgi:hypothetical protein
MLNTNYYTDVSKIGFVIRIYALCLAILSMGGKGIMDGGEGNTTEVAY